MAIKTMELSNLAIPPGEHLQEETEYRGIGQDELAAALDMTVPSVEEIFVATGQSRPKRPRLWITFYACQPFSG